MQTAFVITIDGPAGAGKSTVAKLLGKKIRFLYLDTGALYRTVALYLKTRDAINAPDSTIEELLKQCQIEYDERAILLNGISVSSEIRTPEISELSSLISIKRVVRDFLTKLQRKIASSKDVVSEGRDSGTVVFPHGIKFFLTASIEERTRRRWKELKEKGIDIEINAVKASIIKRDDKDSERTLAPLKPALDAIIIDTSKLSPSEVVEIIIEKLKTIAPGIFHSEVAR